MNYALFAEYVRDIQQELTERFGVPAGEASAIAMYVEVAAVTAEAKERRDSQLMLDFKQHGPSVMAERLGLSRQATRKRFNQAVKRKMESVVVGAVA